MASKLIFLTAALAATTCSALNPGQLQVRQNTGGSSSLPADLSSYVSEIEAITPPPSITTLLPTTAVGCLTSSGAYCLIAHNSLPDCASTLPSAVQSWYLSAGSALLSLYTGNPSQFSELMSYEPSVASLASDNPILTGGNCPTNSGRAATATTTTTGGTAAPSSTASGSSAPSTAAPGSATSGASSTSGSGSATAGTPTASSTTSGTVSGSSTASTGSSNIAARPTEAMGVGFTGALLALAVAGAL